MDAWSSWADGLMLNLLARLAELIETELDCRRLQLVVTISRSRLRNPEKLADGRSVHRDLAGALGAGCATTFTLFLGNLLWIASGWEDGANGVMLAGVFFAIYSGNANPTLLLRSKFTGVALRLFVGAAYVLVVMPSIDGFPMLMLALAPPLLICGALMTVPRHSPLSFNLIIGLLGPGIISERFRPDFALYLNTGFSTLTGIYFALIMMQLTQFLWVDGTVIRMEKAAGREIGRLRFGRGDVAIWRGRMMHRLALIGPAVATDMPAAGDLWRDLLYGLCLARTNEAANSLPLQEASVLRGLVEEGSIQYRKNAGRSLTEQRDGVLARADEAFRQVNALPSGSARRGAQLALVSLWRNLASRASEAIL